MSATGIRGAAKATGQVRRCRHKGEFVLVRRFDGCEVWQCQTCRKTATVITRPIQAKTCLACGKGLKGRQRRWCSSACETFYAAHLSRTLWSRYIKRRDKRTCQRCGWKSTRESKALFESARKRIKLKQKRWSLMKIYHEACRETGYRILEAHHILPLEHGGPELDVANGTTLCHLCHDETHRALNAT